MEQRSKKMNTSTRTKPSVAKVKIKIHLASTPKEKEQVYRFRYQIYVREMDKLLSTADHRRQLLIDDMDDWGLLFYARVDDEIIATSRFHLGRKDNFSPELIQAFSIENFDKFNTDLVSPNLLSFSSKTMIAPHYRHSQAYSLLMDITYNTAHDHGNLFIFAGGAPVMASLYEHTGWRRYKDNFTVPEYGYMVPMVMLTDDVEHLRLIRSPLWHTASKLDISPKSASWFTREFPEATTLYINKHLTDKFEFWKLLSKKLGQPPEKAITLFSGLSEYEAQICANAGHLIFCRENDIIVHPYNMSEEIFVVVSGVLSAQKQYLNRQQRVTTCLPGQSFGEKTFADHARHGTTLTAQTDTDILVFSRFSINQLEIRHPEIAAKLWRNIMRTKLNIGMYA